MSRSKENNPLSNNLRNGHTVHRPKLPSDDFFTDSLIDDSRVSNTSQIPSPVKAKAGAVKPRRAVGASKALQAAKDSGNRSKRSALLDFTAARTKQLQPPPNFTKRKSPSPAQPNGLTTPPQSRHGPPLNSPTEFSSPPGGLHESYQRIADEEDLAATEREFNSDGEEIESDQQDSLSMNVDVDPAQVESKGPPQEARASEHSTPVRLASYAEKENNFDDERTGSFSAPPTLDFLQNEMSDRVLASKLTPHIIDRARDRARLEKFRQSVPINFEDRPKETQANGEQRWNDLASIANRAPISFDNVLPNGLNGVDRAYSDTSADLNPRRKVQAFSKANRRAAKETVPEDDDGSDTPDELRERERTVAFSKANRRRNKPVDEIETQGPTQLPKLVAFPRAYGRPRLFVAPQETNEEQHPPDDNTVASVTSTSSAPLPGATPQRDRDATRSFLAKWRKEAAAKQASRKQEKSDDGQVSVERPATRARSVERQEDAEEAESEIDWAAAAGADVPLPSIEKSSTPRDTPPPKVLPSPISKQKSIDRVRKWENDFTGMSFQVSESPPVRSRNNLNDLMREKEIEDLTKNAVTSNRLDQIRVKDPNIIVRKSSRNFSPEERRSAPSEQHDDSPGPHMDDNRDIGQSVPDTPVVVYRSSSQSTDKSKSSHGSMPDSLDQLQRLARAVSTTPRASPRLQEMVREVEEASGISLPHSEDESRARSPEILRNGNKNTVAETPKVAGAWTDTILPDTIKTQKQTQKVSKYAQTPHVNAGGWIDTPVPNEGRAPKVSIPYIVEEDTEDLTNGNMETPTEDEREEKEKLEQQSSTSEDAQQAREPQPSTSRQIVLPSSALMNVLNEAKQKRLVSRDITDTPRDDTETLNLGDATMQSMEDLITDAADITADLTTLIKASAEEEVLVLRQRDQSVAFGTLEEGDSSTSEMAFIGHLTSRMERLMSNLHEARKGISRLEQKFSLAPDMVVQSTGQQVIVQDPTQPCTVCGRSNDDLTTHSHSHKYPPTVTSFMALPIAYTTFTVPIPLLFHPRPILQTTKQNGHIRRILSFLPGRLTWLGYLTFTVWSWYILECIMTELYARPLFAERYVFPPPGIAEPEFPFVLLTMLYRWMFGGYGKLLTTPLLAAFAVMGRLVVAVYRLIAMALGWTDGFVDDERTKLASATRAAAKVVQSILPTAEGDGGWSMNNDEVL